ncbi:MAG: chorismate synthase [Brumimicrobium sp.]|nr:chorismate synthase [Flavobacteriaceae bacterium]
MPGNTIGHSFRLTTFGESHGVAIGGIIDGMPAGVKIDLDKIQQDLDRRKPGQSSITTQRKEDDKVQILSGIFGNKTTGTPIGFLIQNKDHKSKDYSHIKDIFRPSHADFTYQKKYGIRDFRGGGRSSARETACRIVAGAIAKQYLFSKGIVIEAFVSQVGNIQLEGDLINIPLPQTENDVRCPDSVIAQKMIASIKAIKKQGDTIGGVVFCRIKNVPAGLGEPVFDKLQADLGKAMLSINAVKGFEYGSGFSGVTMKGSEHNDEFLSDNKTKTNFSGGIQGGISNGQTIYFKVAFKPVATIMKDQNTIDEAGKSVVVKGKGRHDACVVPRAVPIIEAMAGITIIDHYLRNKISQTND